MLFSISRFVYLLIDLEYVLNLMWIVWNWLDLMSIELHFDYSSTGGGDWTGAWAKCVVGGGADDGGEREVVEDGFEGYI